MTPEAAAYILGALSGAAIALVTGSLLQLWPRPRAADLREAMRRFPGAITIRRNARKGGARWFVSLYPDGGDTVITTDARSVDEAALAALASWRANRRNAR